jgi:RNA polymerase-binding protein DksA
MTPHDGIRTALQQKLEQMQRRMDKIQHDLRQAPEPDSEEQAIERENDEVLERLDDGGREEMKMIKAALARIDAGTYGICVQCGKSISAQRLTALPYATTCIRCAR